MKDNTVIVNDSAICSKCDREFDRKVPVVIDGDSNNDWIKKIADLSIFKICCPFCGNNLVTYHLFVYHSFQNNHLFAVIPEKAQIQLDYELQMSKIYLEMYCNTLSQENQEIVKNTEMKYIFLPSFLHFIKSPFASDADKNKVAFYPFPKIDIYTPEKHEKVRGDYNKKLLPNEVCFLDNNTADLFNNFPELIDQIMRENKYFLDVKLINESQKPIATYGVPEILIYIGSNFLLPVLASVISSLLYDTILKPKIEQKKNKKAIPAGASPITSEIQERINELSDNPFSKDDSIKLVITNTQNNRKYTIEGIVENVIKSLKLYEKR